MIAMGQGLAGRAAASVGDVFIGPVTGQEYRVESGGELVTLVTEGGGRERWSVVGLLALGYEHRRAKE